MRNEEAPYIVTRKVVEEIHYNPKYGNDRVCECGHTYDRHFDSYEDMAAVGCKYCECYEFKEAIESDKIFLVRRHDYAVWCEDPTKPGCYHDYEPPGKETKNRHAAYDHWTFDNLLNQGFFVIDESQVPEYMEKHNFEIKFTSWQYRNDGHGGSKGGTKEEYLTYLQNVADFQKNHEDW
jgi:hypothetical protein